MAARLQNVLGGPKIGIFFFHFFYFLLSFIIFCYFFLFFWFFLMFSYFCVFFSILFYLLIFVSIISIFCYFLLFFFYFFWFFHILASAVVGYPVVGYPTLMIDKNTMWTQHHLGKESWAANPRDPSMSLHGLEQSYLQVHQFSQRDGWWVHLKVGDPKSACIPTQTLTLSMLFWDAIGAAKDCIGLGIFAHQVYQNIGP